MYLLKQQKRKVAGSHLPRKATRFRPHVLHETEPASQYHLRLTPVGAQSPPHTLGPALPIWMRCLDGRFKSGMSVVGPVLLSHTPSQGKEELGHVDELSVKPLSKKTTRWFGLSL